MAHTYRPKSSTEIKGKNKLFSPQAALIFEHMQQFEIRKNAKKYKSEIVILFLISIIFTIPINQFFENSIEIFICSVLIFSVDKIYDEIQRVLVLKKDFNAWSTITNLKNITLVIFLLNPIININIIYLGITYFIIKRVKIISTY